MTKDEALNLALEAMLVNNSAWKHLADSGDAGYWEAEEQGYYQLNEKAIKAVEAALEAKDEPVGLIDSLKDAKPCCGQYETCWRACTPRGKFLGQRDAQRTWVGLTDEEIAEVEDEYIVDYRIPAGSAWNFAKDIEAKLKEKNHA
jgi:hypothetical protein